MLYLLGIDFEHHLQISVGDYSPLSWLMSIWDMYQPLVNPYPTAPNTFGDCIWSCFFRVC